MLDEYELSKKERAQRDTQDRMVRDYERSDRDNGTVRQELERAAQECRDEKRHEREERDERQQPFITMPLEISTVLELVHG